MSLTGLLNTTTTVTRKAQTQSTATGAKVSTWSSAATGVPCAVQMSSSSEDRLAARETGHTRYNVFFEYGTDVRVGDRLTWGSRLLSVIGPGIDEAGRQSHLRFSAEEIDGGGTL